MTNSSLVERLTTRETLRLCTAGSVDDGKSTFVGRLLYDTKSVLADQVESMERTSTDRGFDGMDLSLLVDGLRAEREQGITIDVAYRYFATDKRTFILADTPGHVQYTRNTVTGMSTSQVVVLLIDARHGVVEQEMLRQEEDQDAAHAVVGEAFPHLHVEHPGQSAGVAEQPPVLPRRRRAQAAGPPPAGDEAAGPGELVLALVDRRRGG